jgi:hypothetical protein
MVLTSNQIMNLLRKELVPDAAEKTNVAAPIEFINNTECDVLYVPQKRLMQISCAALNMTFIK